MTRTETAKILLIVRKSYPGFYKAESDVLGLLDVWSEVMADYSYDQINAALLMYLRTDTRGFPPVPGQLLAQVDRIAQTALPEADAWAQVQKAISNSGYHAGEEFDALPETVRKAVGSPSTLRAWGMGSPADAERSFGRRYKAAVEQAQYTARMPKTEQAALTCSGS